MPRGTRAPGGIDRIASSRHGLAGRDGGLELVEHVRTRAAPVSPVAAAWLAQTLASSRARFKFVIKKLGIDEVNRLIREERAKLRPDPRWTAYIADVRAKTEGATRPGGPLTLKAPTRKKRPTVRWGAFRGDQFQSPSAISEATSARALRIRSSPQVSTWPKNRARAPFAVQSA